MRLILVRHGQTSHNIPGGDGSDPDPLLTPLGESQARAAARALVECGATALYAGPQRRALQTAAALAETLGVAAHVHPDLCECGGVGAHPGLCRDAIGTLWPTFTLDDGITESGWWRGGESDTDEATFYARAHRAHGWLRARHEVAGETVVVVTHGRFGSALLSAILGLSPLGYNRFSLDNGAVSEIDYQPQTDVGYLRRDAVAVRLKSLNRTAHLP